MAECSGCTHPIKEHASFGCTGEVGACTCELTQEALRAAVGLTDVLHTPTAVPQCSSAPSAIGDHLDWWDAWLCEHGCRNRYFTDRTCCGRRCTPVTVTVSRREVTA